jgi:Tfp pilus assembly protein PilF
VRSGNNPESHRDIERAPTLARRAVDLTLSNGTCLNTMGVLLYRAGRYDEAIAMLERSGAAHRGQFDGFDLFFLAMAHRRLGRRDQARNDFDRAVRWVGEQGNLFAQHTRELAEFRAEAVLAERAVSKLPDEVFAP